MNEAFRGTVMIITELAATEVTRGYLTGEIHSALRTSVRTTSGTSLTRCCCFPLSRQTTHISYPATGSEGANQLFEYSPPPPMFELTFHIPVVVQVPSPKLPLFRIVSVSPEACRGINTLIPFSSLSFATHHQHFASLSSSRLVSWLHHRLHCSEQP
jgi:hypothetical protein